MQPARFAAVRKAFDVLCELPLAQALASIDRLDLDAEQQQLLVDMLQSDQRGAPLPVDQPEHLILPVLASSYVGNKIGPWQIERVLGTGGMGRVFLARRHDGLFEGQVAIKFLSESSSGALFAKERAALARLNAPGIARLIDAGTDEQGRAYLVMEFVAGVLIDDWCQQQGLSARTRIGLIIETLQAIAHAHSQMVLHRDLKPSNLIVDTEGRVKVLDFGIAKLLDRDETDFQATAARYFTLRYAAPEQISGEPIGIGTDVFALAVVLYELLADQHPFLEDGADRRVLAERVLTQAPLSLTRAAKADALRQELGQLALRDLDAILLRALSRQPEQRFRSAMDFAEELERVLNDQPVLSRRPGWLALSARQIRRHPWISLSALLALLGLMLTTVIALEQRAEARRERDQAQHEAARAERMASFLSSLFESAQPRHSGGQTASVAELLERGQEKLQRETQDDPLLQARLTLSLADTWRALGQLDRAQTMLESLLAGNPAVAKEPRLAAEAHARLARVLAFRGDWQAALTMLYEAERELMTSPEQPVLHANILKQQGIALMNLDRVNEAIPIITRARDQLLPFAESAREELVGAESLVATAAFMAGDPASARAAYQRIVETERQLQGADRASLVISFNNLAATEARLGMAADAVEHFREAIAVADAVYGADNREAGLPHLGLGMALRQLGQAEPAILELGRAAEIYRKWSGASHPDTRYSQLLLAETRWLADQPDAAAKALSEVGHRAEGAQALSPERQCRARWLATALQRPAAEVAATDRAELDRCRQAVDPKLVLRVLLDWLAAGQPANVPDFLARIDQLAAPDQLLRLKISQSRDQPNPNAP